MIEKALRDEDAYNAFKQSYNSMFDDGYEEGGMKFLDDGTMIDISTGERYSHDDDTGEQELLDEVPTKISSFKGNISVLAVLIRACFGRYNPS